MPYSRMPTAEDLEGLLAHRPAADDQHLHLGEREGAEPLRVGFVEAARHAIGVEHAVS
jgi:hypothetical protein